MIIWGGVGKLVGTLAGIVLQQTCCIGMCVCEILRNNSCCVCWKSRGLILCIISIILVILVENFRRNITTAINGPTVLLFFQYLL